MASTRVHLLPRTRKITIEVPEKIAAANRRLLTYLVGLTFYLEALKLHHAV